MAGAAIVAAEKQGSWTRVFWPGYMEKVGNIAGPLMGYEVLTAFFLEATFLGVMLLGHGEAKRN